MRKIFVFFIWLVCLFAADLHATTYYIANEGNDAADGLTAATAWKSVSKVNGGQFLPGDSILFKRGGKWYETLVIPSSGIAGAPIVVGAYDNGNAPVITGMRKYTGSWSLYQENIWQTSFTGYNPWRLLQDGTEKLMAKTLDEIDGTQYFWYFDDDNNLIYLYSQQDPSGTDIEMNLAENGVFISGKHYLVISDLDMQGGFYRSLGIAGGASDILITHCSMGAWGHMGLAGSSFHDVTIDSCTIDSRFTFDYDVSSQRGTHDGIGFWGNVSHCEILHSIIRDWGHTGITFEAKAGTKTEYNKVHHCLLESPNIPYGRPLETDGTESQYNEICYNIIRNFTVRIQVGGRYNIFHHNLIYDFKNSIIKSYGTAQAFTLQGIEADVTGNVMEYNTIVDLDEPAIQYYGGYKQVNKNYFRNNIIYNAGRNPRNASVAGVAIVLPESGTIAGQSMFNNDIYSPGRTKTVSYKRFLLTAEEFNEKNGVYGDSIGGNIAVNPFFADYHSADFHLRDSSLCINAAQTDTAYFDDFDGNRVPYGMGPDIGAYEFIGKIPLTGFVEYLRNPCDYEVSFRAHAVSNSPPRFHWDFGDGTSSEEKEPVHSYDTAGTYGITMVVADTSGTDTVRLELLLSPVLPLPVARGAERCGPGSVTLTARGAGDTLKWYDAPSGGTLVAMGDTFRTPVLENTVTYYVASVIQGVTEDYHGGKENNSGGGGYYEWDDVAAIRGLIFDVHKPIVLKSVKVYNQAGQAATRTIEISDNRGNIVATRDIYVPEGESRLQLNFQIPPGTGYFIKAADPHKGLYRNSGGVSFPYHIGDAVTITASDLGTAYYYFFYDWEVEASTDSSSCRTPVTAVIHHVPFAEFTYSTKGITTSFQLKNAVDSCFWDFGDGQTGRERNPVHSYGDAGIYSVRLIGWGSCEEEVSSDTLVKEILVGNVPFLDYDCIGEGYDGYATISSEEPYVPVIRIDETRIIYVSPGGGGDGSSEDNPTTLSTALQNAAEGTTILALDGEYPININFPLLHHVNIVSKNKWGAKINCGSGNALDLGNNKNIHHVNIIGFEVYGDNGGEFIFASGTAKDIGTHHFYLSDMKFHDLKMGLYTGLHSHDWTVDRCMYYNSRTSYLWYMMGWHQTVMNSIMYNNTYYSLAIRGHYPLDEKFDYYHPENNIPITDRDRSWLEPGDWTHKIINNTFGTCTNASRPAYGHIGIYYNKPSDDPPLRSEDVYFPPQNITVVNNAFIDKGPIHKKPVVIFAERGINTGEVWSVNGVYIYNNVTDKPVMLVQEDYSIGSIDLSKNTVNATQMGFMNEAVYDYRLTEYSTDLLDKGSTTPFIPNNDFRQGARNDHPDIGAYEYYELPAGKRLLQNKAGSLYIYPNPATDYIRLALPETVKKGRVVIYNNLAREVKDCPFGKDGKQMKEIFVRDLARGLYLCRIYDLKGNIYSGKFIVIR